MAEDKLIKEKKTKEIKEDIYALNHTETVLIINEERVSIIPLIKKICSFRIKSPVLIYVLKQE